MIIHKGVLESKTTIDSEGSSPSSSGIKSEKGYRRTNKEKDTKEKEEMFKLNVLQTKLEGCEKMNPTLNNYTFPKN